MSWNEEDPIGKAIMVVVMTIMGIIVALALLGVVLGTS